MSKITQAINLGGGLFLGQGLYFVANFQLAQSGALSIVGELGILLSLLSVFQWVGDAGGLIMFSGLISSNKLKGQLLSFFAARLLNVFVFFVFFYFVYRISGQEFDFWVWLIGVSCGVVWSLNIAGVLDYYSLNRSVAWLSNLNWAFAATMVIVFGKDVNVYHVLISYFIGGACTVIVQWVYLIKNKEIVFDKVFDFELVKLFFKEFFWFNFGYSASQLYARLLPVIVSQLLGKEMAGVVVFAKNVSNAAGQCFIFLRRVSFSETVAYVKGGRASAFNLVAINKISVSYVFLISVLSIILFCWSMAGGALGILADFTLLLLSLSFVWGLGQIQSSILIALGLNGSNTLVVSFASVFGIFASWFFLSIGIYYLVLIELLVYLIVLLGVFLVLKKKEILYV